MSGSSEQLSADNETCVTLCEDMIVETGQIEGVVTSSVLSGSLSACNASTCNAALKIARSLSSLAV
jgi:hypothetical protein